MVEQLNLPPGSIYIISTTNAYSRMTAEKVDYETEKLNLLVLIRG